MELIQVFALVHVRHGFEGEFLVLVFGGLDVPSITLFEGLEIESQCLLDLLYSQPDCFLVLGSEV